MSSHVRDVCLTQLKTSLLSPEYGNLGLRSIEQLDNKDCS